jgi:hypothetical protein
MKQGTTMGNESYTGDDMAELHRELSKQINTLTAQLTIAIEALEHYANPEQHIYVDGYGKVLFDDSDNGPIVACEALAKITK